MVSGRFARWCNGFSVFRCLLASLTDVPVLKRPSFSFILNLLPKDQEPIAP